MNANAIAAVKLLQVVHFAANNTTWLDLSQHNLSAVVNAYIDARARFNPILCAQAPRQHDPPDLVHFLGCD